MPKPRNSVIKKIIYTIVSNRHFWIPILFGGLSSLFFISLLFFVFVNKNKSTQGIVLGEVTSQSEWENGEYYPGTIDTTTTGGDLQIKSGGVGTWDASTPGFSTDIRGRYDRTPEPSDIGADLTTDGTYIYMIKGGHEPALFRYNPDLNNWKQLADAPTDFYYGSAITYNDGFLYAIAGHYDTYTLDESGKLYAYDIKNNSWEKKTGLNTGEYWGRGADLESDQNGHLFAVQGEAQTAFWIYTVADDSWTAGAIRPTFSTANSHPLVYSSTSFGTDPIYCEQGCIYAFAGGARTFFRYDIAYNGGQWFYGFADIASGYGNVAAGSALVHDPVNGNLYAFRGGNTEFLKYIIADPGTWDAATGDTENTQITTGNGAALVYSNGYIYATFTNVPEFGRYNITSGHWENIYSPVSPSTNTDGLIAFVPYSDAVGSDCTYTGGCLFTAQGGGTGFRRFNLSSTGTGARTWDTLTVLPGNPGAGGSMCYDGTDNIYILRGGSTDVYVYSIDAAGVGSFGANLTTPGAVGAGASITCMGNDEFYVLRGVNQQSFYHYHGTWDTENNIPAVTVSAGAALAHVGSTVYALAGNNRGNFYSFDGTNWTALNDLPTASYHTGSLEYDGTGNLYAIVGKYSKEFWRYDISAGTWSRAADLPDRVAYSTGLTADTAGGKMYYLRGWGYNMIRVFNFETHDYIPSASWISDTIDLTYIDPVTGFTAFTADETLNSETIDYYTRTSDDGVTWSTWAIVSDGEIASDPKRYLQVKVVLNSASGTATPVLHGFTVTYAQDASAPTNPTIAGYTDSTEVTPISSGNTYHYVTPYFELAGASDGQSGITGYSVAWTSSSSAPSDLTTNSNYWQTGTTYQVNTPLTSGTTYHLFVATKNGAGISATATNFTYTYSGITSVSTHPWTTQDQFDNGSNSSIDWSTSSGDVTLAHVANGVWTNEAATPATIGNGSSIVFDGNNTMYLLRANTSQSFYSYSLTGKTYNTLANYGVNVTTGSSSVYVPYGDHCSAAAGCIFATQGGTATFKKYVSDSWSSMANVGAPGVTVNVSTGSSMAFDGDETIYLLTGGSTKFYKYIISDDEWTPLTDNPQSIGAGGTLVFVPNGDYCTAVDGCLYATQGTNTTHFMKYADNVWTYTANTPTVIGDGAAAYYLNGYIYLPRGNQFEEFLRYNILEDEWEYLSDVPGGKYQGSSQGIIYNAATQKMYTLRGYGEYALLRYDVPSNTWETPVMPHYFISASLLGPLNGATAYDSTNKILYVARGQASHDWWAYDLTTKSWTKKTDVPHQVSSGADAVFINGTIYLMVGNESLNDNIGYFYSYSPTTDLWTRLENMPGEPGDGADLAWDGSNTIYTAQGNNSNVFYSYSISVESGNHWATLNAIPNVPAANVRYGGCAAMANDDVEDNIYLVKGNNQDDLYRYDINSSVWSPNNNYYSNFSALGNIQYGDICIPDGQGNILIPRGSNNTTPTTDMYVYNVSGNSWTNRSTLADFYYGDLTMTSNNVIRGFRGRSTSNMEEYVVTTDTTGYSSSGAWTSEIIDLEPGANDTVYQINGVAVTDSLATETQTALSYETRTCADSSCTSASSWTALTSLHTSGDVDYYTVVSPQNRYFQVRALFTSDQIKTATINDITLNYYVDGTSPSNPSNLVVQDDEKETIDVDPTSWHNSETPYFVWSGAADNDGGVGISGYYVYFGTDADIDPASSESYFQTDTTYEASSLTAGQTYYLRIKTKDYAGNISDVWTWETSGEPAVETGQTFTYNYDNIRPGRPTNVSVSPAVPTSTNSFDFTWTSATDAGGSPYFQYCYMRYLDAMHYDGSETCISSTQTSINDLEALGEGTNTFRIRSKDAAGNYSNNDEWETVSFRYALTPPALPREVEHGSVEDDPYSHTFSWNEPETHSFDIITYCYQVNEEPTASFCNNETYGRWTTSTETSARFLAAFHTPNTQPGTNYLYIVAKDEAGNVDWEPDYDCDTGLGCIAFNSTTITPNTPQNFDITDASDRASETYRLTLGWRVPADNPGSVLNKYNIYRSIDGTTFTLRESLLHSEDQNEYAYTDVALDNETTYYYKLTAIDLAGAESNETAIESQRPEGKFINAPDLVGTPTVQPRIRSAVLTWLTGDADTHPASSFVQYGVTNSLGDETGSSQLTGEHSVTLLELLPDTTYFYRLKWVDQDLNEGYSVVSSFTTNDAPSAPRNLVVDPSTSTLENSFTFSWEAPVDEGVTIGGYYYSVNDVPTDDNTTFITNTSVGPVAAASKQGVNTFYLIAEDDSGNHSFSNYTSITFTVNTPDPSAPATVSITDSSDRASEDFALTIRWSSVEGISHYNIFRSTDGTNYEQNAQTESTAYLDTGLSGESTYYYKIQAEDNANALGEFSDIVSKQPTGRFVTPPSYTSD